MRVPNPNEEFISLLGADLYASLVAHLRTTTDRLPDETDASFDFAVDIEVVFLLVDIRAVGTGFQRAIRRAVHQHVLTPGTEASPLLDTMLEAGLRANKKALVECYRDRLGPLTEAVVGKILKNNAN